MMTTYNIGRCGCCGGCFANTHTTLTITVNMQHRFFDPDNNYCTPSPPSCLIASVEERQSFCAGVNGTYVFDLEDLDQLPSNGVLAEATAREAGQFGGDYYYNTLQITERSCTRLSASLTLRKVRLDNGPGGFVSIGKAADLLNDGSVEYSTEVESAGIGAGLVRTPPTTGICPDGRTYGLWGWKGGTCDMLTFGASGVTCSDVVSSTHQIDLVVS